MDLMLHLQEAHHFIRTTMRKPTRAGWLAIANTDATNLKDKTRYILSPVEIGMRILQEPACLI
jgi:hypothetical protein